MHSSTQKRKLPLRGIVVFALLGTIMYVTFFIMQGIPNIHLVGIFIAAITLAYRVYALIPIYVYVLLYGIFSGFSMFWVPYVYIWLPLWSAFMLAGKINISKKIQIPLYMVICGLHGLAFGTLYAPVQALFFGLSFKGMIAWIVAGLGFDVIHAVSNFILAAMIIPLAELLKKVRSKS